MLLFSLALVVVIVGASALSWLAAHLFSLAQFSGFAWQLGGAAYWAALGTGSYLLLAVQLVSLVSLQPGCTWFCG